MLRAFPDHPDRAAALGEAHARPSLPISPPATVLHLALSCTDDGVVDAFYAALFDAEPATASRHTIRTSGGITVKFERHTEFVSTTLLAEDASASEALLAHVQAAVPEGCRLLVALRMRVVPAPAEPPHHLNVGGRLRGDVEVATSFRRSDDGFIDYFVTVGETGPEQLGRRLQRVLEAETYRTMALLGLPLARRVGPSLAALEDRLSTVTDLLAAGEGSDADVLDRLQSMSAEVESLRAQTRFRFSASRAYATLVEERLDALNEDKIGERQTLIGFTRTRLRPAIRTIVSAEARMEELSEAVGRALALLRARIDVSLNRANQDILESMNERQHRQLLLSEAVESLSVIAISYYLLGILSYPVKTLIELGWLPVSETVALGILAPFVAFAVFATLRGVRRRIMKRRSPRPTR